MAESDWLADMRARVEAELEDPPWADMGEESAMGTDDLVRLLACAEALRELVALRDDFGPLPGPEYIETKWERAREALRGTVESSPSMKEPA